MELYDMIITLLTNINERVEIRDSDGNELFTCPTDSDELAHYGECEVISWFPHGAPGKDATFTVSIDTSKVKGGET